MRPVAAGVAGVGRLGAEHARVLSEAGGARLVGLHDRRPERGEEVARRTRTRHVLGLEELLEEAEALVVAVPTAAHHEVALAALQAGCHTLVEKPLASSLEEVDELAEAAGRMGRRLCVGRVERFNGAVRAARRHVSRPRFMEAERLAPFRRRGTDVGVVLDLMIHDLDLALALVDAPVRDVQAVGVSVLSDSVDLANARLTFADGAVAELTASRVSTKQARRFRVFQESGYLSLDLEAEEGRYLRRAVPSLPPDAAEGIADVARREPIRGDGREPLRLELEAFLGAVRGRDTASISAHEARPALELALRITHLAEESTHVASGRAREA